MATVKTPAEPSPWCGRLLPERETMTGRATRRYSALAISNAEQLLYGVSPHPLDCGLGLTVGGGLVYP
ncbi:MAG: methyltransferase MtaB domain-containing protein, partial [Acidobacteriaceae bacterium]